MMRALVLCGLLSLVACKSQEGAELIDRPPITAAWSDSFERGAVGEDYHATAASYQLMNGALSAKGAYNHPLWLRKQLPGRAIIELDVWSNSPDGDIKVEFFGDGKSHAHDKGAYKATGYVACMGGWNNSKSFLARQDEHGQIGVDLVVRTQPKVEVGKRYHWKIVRSEQAVEWYVDDMTTPFLRFEDSTPLEGPDHAYFGFNNWQSDAWYDNLSIQPL